MPENREWLHRCHLTWGSGSPGAEPRSEGGGGVLEELWVGWVRVEDPGSHPRGSTCILLHSFWELIFSLWLGNAYVAVKKPQNYVFLHLLRLALSPHSLSVTSQPPESTLQIFHHCKTCYIKIKNLTTAWSSQKSYYLFLLWLILIELGSKCPSTGVRKSFRLEHNWIYKHYNSPHAHLMFETWVILPNI